MTRINNEFRLSGRMGADVEIIRPEGRSPIGKVSIAVDNGYKDRQTGEYIESTMWADLTFYNPKQIERLAQYAGKGREIYVMGTIGKDVWESKSRTNPDGSAAKDTRVTLLVTQLQLGREPRQQAANAPGGQESHGDSGHDDSDDIPF